MSYWPQSEYKTRWEMAEEATQKSGQLRVGVCTSAQKWNVEGFIQKLEAAPLITHVRFIELPYNDLNSFQLGHNIHVLFLCHSINNRRFAITNVLDALYDEFLPYVKGVMGQQNVGVIGHDFKSADLAHKDVEMDNFRSQQPLTFECSALQVLCGKLEHEPEISDDDWARVENFLATVARGLPVSLDGMTNEDDEDDVAPLLFRDRQEQTTMDKVVRFSRDAGRTLSNCLVECLRCCYECISGCVRMIQSKL